MNQRKCIMIVFAQITSQIPDRLLSYIAYMA